MSTHRLPTIAWIFHSAMFAGAISVLSASPAPPAPPPQSAVVAMLAKPAEANGPLRPMRIVLLADKKDHKENEHDYPIWQERWGLLLGGKTASAAAQVNLFGPAIPHKKAFSGADGVTVSFATGWPSDQEFASANVIVAFCYLNWNDARKQQIREYLDRGGGLALIHSATWTKPKPDAGVAALVGVGGFTRFRHGPMQLEIVASGHPICSGLPRQLSLLDEPYWPPTPPIAQNLVTTLAVSSEENADTKRPSPQPMFWTTESGRGRVFGCVPGHYTWTFDDPWFRLLLLRGIAWAGNGPVHRFDPLVLRGARVSGE
ncbi:MAG TPA: ThuA domain-containing protein [Verrucomicrobiae bacterium]|nr:ThuA domain-containing protein [Verrucomicrobiae bacterium]